MKTSSSSFVRGSSLLLAGRFISLAVNLIAQVIIVRYLSKTSFGSYAYALRITTLASIVAGMGFQITIARFASIYRTQKEYPKMFGSLVYLIGMIIGVSLAIIAGFLGARGLLAEKYVTDPAALSVLFILIYFIPVNALDRFLENAVAVFAGARAIFVRRHLAGPILKLMAVLVVIALSGNERMLAVCFLIASSLGVLLYFSLLYQGLRKDGLLKYFNLRSLSFPAGALFRFGMPIMLSDINLVIRSAVNIILLGMLFGSVGVAEYRAVIPLAELNKMVSRNFTLLFIPYAAKLLAKKDDQAIENLLQSSIAWISILSFPIFLVCFALATPVTTLILGAKYASSGPILSVLSFGFFIHAMLSFSAHILKVYNKLSVLVTIELGTTVIIAALAFWWIPKKGGLGAALAVATGDIIQCLVTFLVMGRLTKLKAFTSRSLRLYCYITIGAALLWSVQYHWAPAIWIGLPITILLAIGVFAINRDMLSLQGTFPELEKIPFLKKLAK